MYYGILHVVRLWLLSILGQFLVQTAVVNSINGSVMLRRLCCQDQAAAVSSTDRELSCENNTSTGVDTAIQHSPSLPACSMYDGTPHHGVCTYMMMDHLQGRLREMLSQVAQDLIKVSDGLLHENEEACRRTDSNTSGEQFSVRQTLPCDQNLEGPRVDSALEVFRQLGHVVKVRLQMLDVYQEFFATVHLRDVESSLSVDLMGIMNSSKETLKHPIIMPLANLLDREMLVLKYALEVEALRTDTSTKFETTISRLLDFRTAQTAWEGQPSGQFSLCRKMQTAMRSFARTLPHEDQPVTTVDSRSGCTTPPMREDHMAGISKRCSTRVSSGGDSSKGRIGLAGGDIKSRIPLYIFPSNLAQRKGHDGTDPEKTSDQQTVAPHAITHYPNGLEINTSGFVYSMRSSRCEI